MSVGPWTWRKRLSPGNAARDQACSWRSVSRVAGCRLFARCMPRSAASSAGRWKNRLNRGTGRGPLQAQTGSYLAFSGGAFLSDQQQLAGSDTPGRPCGPDEAWSRSGPGGAPHGDTGWRPAPHEPGSPPETRMGEGGEPGPVGVVRSIDTLRDPRPAGRGTAGYTIPASQNRCCQRPPAVGDVDLGAPCAATAVVFVLPPPGIVSGTGNSTTGRAASNPARWVITARR